MSQHKVRARAWTRTAEIALAVGDYAWAAQCARRAVQEARKVGQHFASSRLEVREAARCAAKGVRSGVFTLGQVVSAQVGAAR